MGQSVELRHWTNNCNQVFEVFSGQCCH